MLAIDARQIERDLDRDVASGPADVDVGGDIEVEAIDDHLAPERRLRSGR